MIKKLMVVALMGATVAGWGCSAVPSEEPVGVAADVAAKAEQVVERIGGPNGFGGATMMGYAGHMTQHMGFHSQAYLADSNGVLNVELANSTGFPCTFHLAYIRSEDGVEQQTVPVVVNPGEVVEFTMPCAEIIGVGSLTDVGAVAAEWPDGTAFGNRYCVPGFLNSDYACGGTYQCVVGPDVDDLDQDGDTEELIVESSGMWSHMRASGMGQHMWDYRDDDNGMMSGWTGGMGGWSGGMMGGWYGGNRPAGSMMSGSSQ